MTDTAIVGTADLRAALASVAVHATTDKEDAGLHRVRLLWVDGHVVVTASDRYTAALAIVSTWDDSDYEPGVIVELAPDDVAKILRVFKAGKDAADEHPDYMLRLEAERNELTITDVSGFDIIGHSLSVPRLSVEPALSGVAWLIQRQHEGSYALLVGGMAVNGDYLARFKVAGKVYHAAVVLEARADGRALLLRVGDSFLGAVSPRRLTEEQLRQAKEWSEGWDNRLPAIVKASSTTGPKPAQGVDLDEVLTTAQADGDVDTLCTAAEVIIETQVGSASLLQRRLRIGFAKASYVLDRLETLGVVGPAQGAKARAVLVVAGELEAVLDKIRTRSEDSGV